jgi:hypothetical protein
MAGTRHIYDHPFGSNDLAHEEVRKQEVTQMIGSELHFKSVCGLCVVFYGHDTRIVDQDVKAVNAGVDRLRCLVYRGVVAEIERHDHNINLGINFLDLVHDRLDLGLTATGKNYSPWIGGPEG